MLHKAYYVSREEIVALKAATDTLIQKLDENITTTIPPSLDTTTSPTVMEEMMIQLSHIQHDIQDILEAIHNPPSKRKQYTSNQDNELTILINR
jgi:hypothetical protein